MLEMRQPPVNVTHGCTYSKFRLAQSKNRCTFLMGHRRPLAFGLFHEEKQGKHDKKHPSEKAKHVVIRQHGRLLLDHAPQCGMSTMVCSYCVHTLPYKCLAHARQGLLCLQTGLGYMLPQIIDMDLHMAELQSLDARNPDAGPDVTHEVEDAGRVPHTFSRDGIVGNGGERDKDQPQAGALQNQG